MVFGARIHSVILIGLSIRFAVDETDRRALLDQLLDETRTRIRGQLQDEERASRGGYRSRSVATSLSGTDGPSC